MRHSTWVKMHTNELIVDAVNTDADRVAGREQVPEDSEPSTDLATIGEDVIVNNEGDDGVEVGIGRNTAPGSDVVPEILGEEREASTDLDVVQSTPDNCRILIVVLWVIVALFVRDEAATNRKFFDAHATIIKSTYIYVRT
jgi:hypothetical protein